ncbi:glycerate kinase [Gracilibacillus dipsosauri]|uniref:Glycerate kinase n=1 Tax=Gracilibacillus dipsosauri TaxID=178340 RepID=A0A317L3M3_9BACI|nr:glycerate kinase [Gracilibacillus dipsosauri]PWU69824.1 glycerate kinase [Gracilibacillus dipsosauri]
MKIVIIPSGFKECLSSEGVAKAMNNGIQRFDPNVETMVIPMIDGGEGFAHTIIKLKKGELIYREVIGPIGEKVRSHFGIFQENGKKTAVIEMAAVAGLTLIPRNKRNPLKTTTFGVGQLIKSALDLGVDDILIGCGDSGTSDGGAGMAEALGVRFLDKYHQALNIGGGGDLHSIENINISGIDPRLSKVKIDVACNWYNILCGPRGVARVFAPQKGANPEEAEQLARNLEYYAQLILQQMEVDVRTTPGGGASGGLGAGLMAFTGATLHPRFDIIMQYIQLEEHIKNADLVLTAEGCLDYQTPNGKIPAEVARIAGNLGVPVIAITGTIGEGASINYTNGIHAYTSIIQSPTSLEIAMKDASRLIADSAEAAVRQIRIGYQMAKRKYKREII